MKVSAVNGPANAILPHHLTAAGMWGRGGAAYDNVSFAISDALAHAAQRLAALPGECVLDIATGTGWSARNVARTGAAVTAIDISGELLAAARELSAYIRPEIDFQLADAERLPFPDESFDRIISTFGVMFAANQRHAASEIARICKPGGRLVIAGWVPGGSVEEFFAVVNHFSDMPAPEVSPLAWGDPAEVRNLLDESFDLTFEHGLNNAYHDGLQQIWDWYSEGFGPVRAVAESLDSERLQEFRQVFDGYHSHYRTEAGTLHVKREYLLTIGHRRQT